MGAGVLAQPAIREPVARALAEDFGLAGYDLTSAATIPAGRRGEAVITAKAPGRIAGLAFVAETFAQLDPAVTVRWRATDGETVSAGAELARLTGPAASLLAGERTALNFLGHLSGIATATAQAVAATASTAAHICCTRKTTPGLRVAEKYAVRCGGGWNHRFGLDDGILIKENHIALAGGVAPAVSASRAMAGHMRRVEVEVTNLAELTTALTAGADAVLLDNMGPATLAEAVAQTARRATLEASGTMTLDRIPSVAATGVDIISAGWLTHSAGTLDVAMDLRPEREARGEPAT